MIEVVKSVLIDKHRLELYWNKPVINSQYSENYQVYFKGRLCDVHFWKEDEEWHQGTVYEEKHLRTTIYIEQEIDINNIKQLTLTLSERITGKNGEELSSRAVKDILYDPYYKKFTKTKSGIQIKSSEYVADETHDKVACILEIMLEKIPYVIPVLNRYNAEVAIYGLQEDAYSIPEHRVGAQIMKRPVEGYGGIIENPVTSVSERNVLRILEGNDATRYPNEMILVHEFAHAIHLIGINHMNDQTLAINIKNSYEHAKSLGKWPKTYAISNYEEYFATATTIWFDVMAESGDGSWDGVRGPVNKRDEMKVYDPDMYDVLKQIYVEKNLPTPWDVTPRFFNIEGERI